ncbi:3'(2'),5'-bisphosphate nucleotidase CysQ [Lutibacter sp.]
MNKNLEIAIIASLEAGKEIMNVYNSAFEVELKEDNSPLTEADKKANDKINSYLIATKIPIISEESKQTDYSERKNWELCWMVDPLDGTKEFVKRNGEFTVNIALIKNGKPILGVIYVPVTKELYYANVVAKTVFKSTLKSHSVSIHEVVEKAKIISSKKELPNKIKVVGSRSHMNTKTVEFIENLKNKTKKEIEIVSKGSSLKFCLVAEGKADMYPRFAPTMEWDTAAGQAICEAAGVEVISLETNKPLLYNKENLLNPWFKVKSNK